MSELKGLGPLAECRFPHTPVIKIDRRAAQLLADGLVVDLTPEEYGESDFASTRRTDVQLLLGKGRYILRELSERNLPTSRIMEMAAIDLADRTPFMASDVRIAPMPLPGKTSYVVVRNDVIEPWLSYALPKAKTRTVRLGIELEGQPIWLSAASARSIDPRIGSSAWRQAITSVVLALLALLILVTVTHMAWRNASASALLEAQISNHRQEAMEVRKMLEVRARALQATESARARKTQAIPLARVWEELTKILPDTTYLTDLSLDGTTVTFSGFAQSAAQLISLVDQSDSFDRPILTGPVSRVPGRSGEQFQIRAAVSRQ
ncbi:PilN domain-containing protein [Ensifer sp. ENS06]|uniref:PilN domain-containing protein n=1 Tax=Ensifer sp. ENS06 TaxID=2769276 RepID=UPI001781F150|nr:PilN domain-containing protein [Ensifer sp. ENS06]MBD9623999.1 PilN domain-containing protein [Ensifer sp. ENS06]